MGKKKFGGKMANKRWKHDPNPWKPLLLIPNDVGLGPIFTDLIGKREEHEEHEVETREISWETKRITSKSC